MIRATYLILVLFLVSCAGEKVAQLELSPEDKIISASIAYYFQDGSDSLDLSFVFRDRAYEVLREGGTFTYLFNYTDTLGRFRRVLSNSGYFEELNGQRLELSAKDNSSHASSVNSVVYFALLPLFLNDEAVIAKLQTPDTIKGKVYDKIEVRFRQEGGGEDFEDVYLYWFDREDYSMDYLAYSYLEEDRGSRFRVAYNPRRINGILFQDYENYKGPAPDSLEMILDLYKAEKLELLSKIELKAIAVNR